MSGVRGNRLLYFPMPLFFRFFAAIPKALDGLSKLGKLLQHVLICAAGKPEKVSQKLWPQGASTAGIRNYYFQCGKTTPAREALPPSPEVPGTCDASVEDPETSSAFGTVHRVSGSRVPSAA